MPAVRDVVAAMDRIAPRRFAYSFDRIGLQVGDPSAVVSRGVVALDASLGAIRFAAESNAAVLVTHHPVIWEPVESIRSDDYGGQRLTDLLASKVALIAAHTNWDCARGGVNDILAEHFELSSVRPFGSGNPSASLKLVTFVPEESLQSLIQALAEAGAGDIGAYARCAFFSPGTGTFVGGEGSNPVVGERGEVVSASEYRLEMVLPAEAKRAVQAAIREVHPYQEPAYDLFPVSSEQMQPIGRLGDLEESVKLSQFSLTVNRVLETQAMAWGNPDASIHSVAVCGGAADEEWRAAQDAGADVLVTGEVRHHVALEAAESGFCVVAAGHFATENPGAVGLALRLKAALPDVDWSTYEPQAGRSGRPL